MQHKQFLRSFFRLAALAAAAGLAGCGPKVENNGYVRNEDLKNLVSIGKSTKDEVQNTLGSPSAQSSFGTDTWYYITDRKEAYAFLKFDVIEQEVTRIAFDDSGVVTEVEHFDQSQSEAFPIVKRETITEGHTLGFFEQMLGNIGRFNAPGNRGGPVAGRRGGR